MPGHCAKSDGRSVTWACRGALLAVISTEIALILLFLLVRIVLDTFSLWQTSMLSIAIGTYAIASKNQGLPKLASTTISKEYFNTWEARNKAKIFWRLYRVILWFYKCILLMATRTSNILRIHSGIPSVGWSML